MNIVILGAPASGKGTQAQLLSEKLKLFHFQTGALSRDLARKNKRLKEIVDSGKLIPEEEMTMYALDYLNQVKPDFKNILFEGFPRFIRQYEALEEFLKVKGDDIDFVISLDIDEKEAIKRLSARRTCRKCGKVYNLITNLPVEKGKCDCGERLFLRRDDKPESVRLRFKYYEENTKKLIDYLAGKKKLIRVDAVRPIDIIFRDILKKIGVKK